MLPPVSKKKHVSFYDWCLPVCFVATGGGEVFLRNGETHGTA